MRRWLWLFFFLAVLSAPGASPLTPRPGWIFVPGTEDLLQTGNWGCLSTVTLGANNVVIPSGVPFGNQPVILKMGSAASPPVLIPVE